MQISAEAEEYFVKSTSTFVSSQSRWIYEQLRDKKENWQQKDAAYLDELKKKHKEALDTKQEEMATKYQEEIARMEKKHAGGLPFTLGRAARDRAIADLKIELKSDEFTKATREMLEQNLVSLVEKTVTQNNRELAKKGRQIIHDLAPLAIDSLLLPIRSTKEAQEKRTEIINSAVDSIKKHFDFEEISFDENFLEIVVKAELNKRIGKIKTQ